MIVVDTLLTGPVSSARNYRPVSEFIDPRFRENKPKTLVVSH
jgi:hypothetical protein